MVKKVRKEDAKLHERPEFQVVVSDPDSPKYGEFWTRDEVADLTSNQIGSNK
eukprot:gene45227-60406_t